jgi:hypothetical protein
MESDELHFPTPRVVIGHGSFGVVLQAEFRGSKVAVKRAYPTRLAGKRNSQSNKQSSGSREKKAAPPPESAPGRDVEQGLSTSKGPTETESSDGDHEREISIDMSIVQSTEFRSVSASTDSHFDFSDRTDPTAPRSSSSFKKDLSWTKTNFIEEMKTLSTLRHPNIITIMGKLE